MEKAVCGFCRSGYFRCGVYGDNWDSLVKRFETVGSCDLTRRRLMLGSRDSTTGWYVKFWEESTVEGVLVVKGASSTPLVPGIYVRSDATLLTADPLEEGDEIVTGDGSYYEVKTVQKNLLGDNFSHYSCDLTFLSLKNLTGLTYVTSSVEDARYRTKVYLETYLNNAHLPHHIVGYGEPDYPLTQVFKTKGVDLTFCIGEPNSTPFMDAVTQAPYGYEEHVPVTHFCISKDNIDGAKLKWQAETELRRIVETYPLGGSVRQLERRRNADHNLGSTKIYGTEWIMIYERDTT